MKKLCILIFVGLLLVFFVGCERVGELVFIDCEGAERTYVAPNISGKPEGMGEEVQLVKIKGNPKCYLASEFQIATDPDACPEVHFHGTKNSVDGHELHDHKPDECGVAKTSDVEFITAYKYVEPGGDDPRDTADPTVHGEEMEDCECTKEEPCCGPDVTRQFHGVFDQIVDDWNSWDATERKNRCETIVDISYADNSWDVREFFNADVIEWAATGCREGNCKRTVRISDTCWVDQVANYTMWGVMTKLCDSVSVGPYDRVLLDGLAENSWQTISPWGNENPTLFNANRDVQDLMIEAGWEATFLSTSGEYEYAQWRWEEYVVPRASESIAHECGECDKPNLKEPPEKFTYRWKNEG